jgi:geranylgeranyl diphosphate synthase type 3
VPQTINTANYVYFLVFAEVFAMNREEPTKGVEEMIVEEMVNLHRGQGMDLYWRDNLVCPTEGEYIEMVNNKTSGLLRIVIKLMVANSPVVKEEAGIEKDVLVPLVNLIGLLFQIRDDYMNLHSGDYAENKGYCEDLTEGKFSFPIIHSIRTSSPDKEQRPAENGRPRASSNGELALVIKGRDHLLSVLQSRPKEARTKRVVVEYMESQTGSFEYSRDVMSRLNKLVKAETASLEEKLGGGKENKRLRGILGALSRGWFESSQS